MKKLILLALTLACGSPQLNTEYRQEEEIPPPVEAEAVMSPSTDSDFSMEICIDSRPQVLAKIPENTTLPWTPNSLALQTVVQKPMHLEDGHQLVTMVNDGYGEGSDSLEMAITTSEVTGDITCSISTPKGSFTATSYSDFSYHHPLHIACFVEDTSLSIIVNGITENRVEMSESVQLLKDDILIFQEEITTLEGDTSISSRTCLNSGISLEDLRAPESITTADEIDPTKDLVVVTSIISKSEELCPEGGELIILGVDRDYNSLFHRDEITDYVIECYGGYEPAAWERFEYIVAPFGNSYDGFVIYIFYKDNPSPGPLARTHVIYEIESSPSWHQPCPPPKPCKKKHRCNKPKPCTVKPPCHKPSPPPPCKRKKR